MTPEAPVTEDQFHAAIDRLARSEDGRSLYLYLQRRRMAVTTLTKTSALRRDDGERQFAAHLMSLMAKGIAESGGRTGSSSRTDGEQPIVFAVAGPRRVSDIAGAGRRVSRDTHVPGWDRTDDSVDGQAGSS
jgi:hypothetical protein